MVEREPKHILHLITVIENAVGRKIKTPKDFNFLAKAIYVRLHILISTTTLKRLWGYLKDGTQARISSLDILSQFVGYRDWDDFCLNFEDLDWEIQEQAIHQKTLLSKQIIKGQQIVVSWFPNRVCILQYSGNEMFRVIRSSCRKLAEGDMFQCGLLVEKEPMYINDFFHNGIYFGGFVIGRKGGISFLNYEEYVKSSTIENIHTSEDNKD